MIGYKISWSIRYCGFELHIHFISASSKSPCFKTIRYAHNFLSVCIASSSHLSPISFTLTITCHRTVLKMKWNKKTFQDSCQKCKLKIPTLQIKYIPTNIQDMSNQVINNLDSTNQFISSSTPLLLQQSVPLSYHRLDSLLGCSYLCFKCLVVLNLSLRGFL